MVMLGTGHAHVTKCYNTCFALIDKGDVFLTDAGGGNGILTRLETAGIRIADIRHLFVSHTHTDHILGAVWVVRLYLAGCLEQGFTGRMTVSGNQEVIRVLKWLCRTLIQSAYSDLIARHIIFKELAEDDVLQILGRRVRFFDIHGTTAAQYGYEMEYAAGKRFVFAGDEPYRPSGKRFLDGAEWAVLEATVPYESDENSHGHATIRSSCEDAERAGVKHLILTHTEDRDINNRKMLYEKEAARFFPGEVYVPDDLDVFDIC